MRLLIAIPVYNERKYVNPVLDRVKTFHPDILVIDDGSTDGTQDILAARRDIWAWAVNAAASGVITNTK